MEKTFDVIARLYAIDKMSKTIEGAVAKSNASLNGFSKGASKLGDNLIGVGTAAGAGAIAMALPLIKMAKDAEAGESAVARLTQVFKSMGEETGVAAKKANEFADSLMYEIAVDADDIMAAQAKLATFEGVVKNAQGSSEIFERATKAAFDLQAAGFGDGASNAVQLGKALNDPIKGINALTRSGVSFNAQEQAKIKALVASGKQFEAQQLILSAIEKQVGGVAVATADDSAKIMLALGDISAEIGKALLPIMKDVATVMVKEVVPAVKQFVADNQPMLKTLGKAAAALTGFLAAASAISFVLGGIAKAVGFASSGLGGLVKVVGLMSKAFWALNAAVIANPIVAAAVAITAAIAAIAYYWDDFNGFLNRQPAFLRGVMKMFIAPIALAAGMIRGIIQIFTGDWRKGLDTILEAVRSFNPIAALADITDGIFSWLGGLGASFFEAGQGFVMQIINGIKQGATALYATVADMAQGIRDYLPFSPAKVGPLSDLDKLKFGETIAGSVNPTPVIGAMSALANDAMLATSVAAAPTLAPAPSITGNQNQTQQGGISVNFAPQITITAATGGDESSIKDQILQALRQSMPELTRALDQYQASQQRRKY